MFKIEKTVNSTVSTLKLLIEATDLNYKEIMRNLKILHNELVISRDSDHMDTYMTQSMRNKTLERLFLSEDENIQSNLNELRKIYENSLKYKDLLKIIILKVGSIYDHLLYVFETDLFSEVEIYEDRYFVKRIKEALNEYQSYIELIGGALGYIKSILTPLIDVTDPNLLTGFKEEMAERYGSLFEYSRTLVFESCKSLCAVKNLEMLSKFLTVYHEMTEENYSEKIKYIIELFKSDENIQFFLNNSEKLI